MAGCDSLSVLPSATVDGLGGMYGKNADRHRTEVRLSRTVVIDARRPTHRPRTDGRVPAARCHGRSAAVHYVAGSLHDLLPFITGP